MNKGFMKLPDHLLEWLGGTIKSGGRVTNTDHQDGCPWQCVTCGVCAGKKTKNQGRKDFNTISTSIQEVYEKKGIDILTDDRVHTFYESDPMRHHSNKDGKDFTMFDIAEDFKKRHYRDVLLATAGWNHKNKPLQNAAEKIVDSYEEKGPNAFISYTIKTVPLSVMKEYDNFVKNTPRNGFDDDEFHSMFIRQSRYASNIAENMKTLGPLNESGTVGYSYYYIADCDLPKLNEQYSHYRFLFSKRFMELLQDHLDQRWSEYPKSSDYMVARSGFYCLHGVGRTREISSIPSSINQKETRIAVNSWTPNMKDADFWAHVNHEGEIQVFYGIKYDLTREYVPKENLEMMAKFAPDPQRREELLTISQLQGHRLLDN